MAVLSRMSWFGRLGRARVGLDWLARQVVVWRGRLGLTGLPQPFYLVTMRAPNLSALITVDGGDSTEQARKRAIMVLRYVAASDMTHVKFTTKHVTPSSALWARLEHAAGLAIAAMFGFAVATLL